LLIFEGKFGMSNPFTAITAPTQYVEFDDRKLAYRSFGDGRPIVLCVRFRGTMDSWDPAFLDALVSGGFQVIIFDYSGLGSSTGKRTYDPRALAEDAIGLIEALRLEKTVIVGWSIGGAAAQIVLAAVPARISHLVLLATTPPGPLVKTGEVLFYQLAKREINDFETLVTLLFEPKSTSSRKAAELSVKRMAGRRTDRSPAVPVEWAGQQIGDGPSNPAFSAPEVLDALKSTAVPVLHIGGDHDIVFPVENWYALSSEFQTLCILTLPQAGHGPHLQYPQLCAAHIAAFVQHSA
jgi:pimeloyl-ACP methyl ester carboxylesterase